MAEKDRKILSESFELVYYAPANMFNGRTHFEAKGQFTIGKPNNRPASTHFEDTKGVALTMEQRFEYLKAYSKSLRGLFGLKKDYLATTVVSGLDCKEAASRVKPKPLPQIRRLIPLRYWKWKLEGDSEEGEDWSQPGYNANFWNELEAPTLINKNRAVLLRTEFFLKLAGRSVLDIESIIDEFSCWANGKLVCQHQGFAPLKIDLTPFLQPGRNCLAIRVEKKPQEQIGLAGEITLVCTKNIFIEDLFINTKKTEPHGATVEAKFTVQNWSQKRFEGSLQIDFFEWFPREKQRPAFSATFPVSLSGSQAKEIVENYRIQQAKLWSPEFPHLYKVRAVLRDKNGKAVDDFIQTCGIRSIEQRTGKIYFNGKEFFIKSFGHNLGFAPAYDMHGAISPQDSWLVRDMLLCKRANANSMRIHPWGHTGKPGDYNEYGWPDWGLPCDSTNYERIAAIADQLGVCLFWGTRCWTIWHLRRMYWGEGYEGKKYKKLLTSSIKRIRNHPSVIIYEGQNEAIFSGTRDPAVCQDLKEFCKRYVKIVNAVDSSRLIIPNTFWGPWFMERGACDQATLMTPNIYWSMHEYIGWYNSFKDLYNIEERYYPGGKKRPFILSECGAEAMPDWSKYKGLPWHGIWLNNGRPCGKMETERLGRPLRILENSEVELSQAYQALCLQQTINCLRRNGVDGMNINLIADGLAEGNYHKGVTDLYRKAKLGFFGAKMSYQEILVTGMDGDFLLSRNDRLRLALINDGGKPLPSVQIQIKVFDGEGRLVDEHSLELGPIKARINELGQYKPEFSKKGLYRIEYRVVQKGGGRR